MSSSPSSSSSSETAKGASHGPAFGWVMDVPCAVDFVLGTTLVKVRDCVQFERDSIVRLKQAAGADLEVRVGGVALATGEAVMVEDSLGVRLNRVLPPVARDVL